MSANYIYMTLQETVLLVLVLRLVLSHVYEGTIYWGTNAIGGPGMWNVHVHPCIEERWTMWRQMQPFIESFLLHWWFWLAVVVFRDLLIKLPLTSVCLKPCLDALQSCLLQPSWEPLFGKVLLSKHPAPAQRLAVMPRSAHRAVFLRWWKLKMKAWTLSCPLAAGLWLVFWLHWLVHPLRWPREISLASILAWMRR